MTSHAIAANREDLYSALCGTGRATVGNKEETGIIRTYVFNF
jgi:hypothetical protein